MKFKFFLAVVLAIVIVLSSSFILYPYVEATMGRAGFNSSPQTNGSFLIYEFSDGAVYSYINGTPTLLQQSGMIEITLNGNLATVKEEISGPSAIGRLSGYTQNFSSNYTSHLSQPLITSFVNSISMISGSIDILDGQTGIARPSLSSDFSVSYSGNNGTVKQLSKGIDMTRPNVLEFPDFIENYSSVNYPYGNYYQYDHAGGWNIMVSAELVGGTTGVSPFLQQLLNNTNFNLPLLLAHNFNLLLIGTNIALQPLDIMHYLTENIVFVALICMLSAAYIVLTYRMAKGRHLNGSRRKK